MMQWVRLLIAILVTTLSRILHEHLVQNVVELYPLHYQRNGRCSLIVLSYNNSYVLQGCVYLTTVRWTCRSASFPLQTPKPLYATELWPGSVLFQPGYRL